MPSRLHSQPSSRGRQGRAKSRHSHGAAQSTDRLPSSCSSCRRPSRRNRTQHCSRRAKAHGVAGWRGGGDMQGRAGRIRLRRSQGPGGGRVGGGGGAETRTDVQLQCTFHGVSVQHTSTGASTSTISRGHWYSTPSSAGMPVGTGTGSWLSQHHALSDGCASPRP